MLSHAPMWDFQALTWAGILWGAINGTSRDIKMEPFLQEKERRKGDWSARLERIGFAASHLVFLTLLS